MSAEYDSNLGLFRSVLRASMNSDSCVISISRMLRICCFRHASVRVVPFL